MYRMTYYEKVDCIYLKTFRWFLSQPTEIERYCNCKSKPRRISRCQFIVWNSNAVFGLGCIPSYQTVFQTVFMFSGLEMLVVELDALGFATRK